MDFKDLKKGDVIEFTAQRVIDGNPVQGVFSRQDDTWFKVKLLKTCSGMVNKWFRGEMKDFRKELVSNLKKID